MHLYSWVYQFLWLYVEYKQGFGGRKCKIVLTMKKTDYSELQQICSVGSVLLIWFKFFSHWVSTCHVSSSSHQKCSCYSNFKISLQATFWFVGLVSEIVDQSLRNTPVTSSGIEWAYIPHFNLIGQNLPVISYFFLLVGRLDRYVETNLYERFNL